MVDTGLKGKIALVTGANHGIGAATALALAREGADIFITYLRLSPENCAGRPLGDTGPVADPGPSTMTASWPGTPKTSSSPSAPRVSDAKPGRLTWPIRITSAVSWTKRKRRLARSTS